MNRNLYLLFSSFSLLGAASKLILKEAMTRCAGEGGPQLLMKFIDIYREFTDTKVRF